MNPMPRITPFLWFDHQAEEAANFYVSIFPNSKVTGVTRYDEGSAKASGQPAGSAMTVGFVLDGQAFTALNGGPVFKFTEAVSFVISCETQAELDGYWEKLTADGGQEVECGWLKDKFGLSWQVTPAALPRLMSDPAKSAAVMGAMLKMKKIDIAALEAAANS
jgi:predicted 3-demethylubiquinone-9 3-methyltransferase (glyoxalase superfamily)